jgi:hypothetical protein
MIKTGTKMPNRFVHAEMKYIDISNVLKSKGYKLNHSACRGIFIEAMKKIYMEISKVIDENNKQKMSTLEIALDSRYQLAIEAYLKEEYASNEFYENMEKI